MSSLVSTINSSRHRFPYRTSCRITVSKGGGGGEGVVFRTGLGEKYQVLEFQEMNGREEKEKRVYCNQVLVCLQVRRRRKSEELPQQGNREPQP